jgi:hypothetical protein
MSNRSNSEQSKIGAVRAVSVSPETNIPHVSRFYGSQVRWRRR